MATYIPGVKDFVPQLEVFTPDYKFLSDVLDTRQDRYTNNYKQLNDLYGKVVYADLSREDNREKRDQYADQLSGKIQQITGMDLSLQQNVDAARGLFKPFYDDDLIVRDMVTTKQYKDEMQMTQRLLDSPNKEVREQYWDYGVKGLNYQMKDFINASPEEALRMSPPKYVGNPNLVKRAVEDLKEQGMTLTGTTFEGDWIVKQKNGSILVKPAREYIEQTLLDDPLVKNGYYTKAYVEAREYGEQHLEEFGSEDRARKQWADGIIQEYHQKQKASLAKTNMQVDEGVKTEKNWKKYEDEYGIIEGSAEDKEYAKILAEMAMLQNVKERKTNRLAEQAEPVKDLDQLLNKAYSALMAQEIGEDMTKAAVAYANIDASVEVDVNPIRKMKHEQNFTEHMENVKNRNRQDAAYQKYLYDMDLQVQKAELEGYQGWDVGLGSDPEIRRDIPGTEDVFTVDGSPGTPDVFKTNDVDAALTMKGIQSSKMDVIEQTGIALKGNGEFTYSVIDNNGAKVQKTKPWSTARKELLQPENEKELERLYKETQDELLYAKDTRPTWLKSGQADAYETIQNLSSGVDNRMRRFNRVQDDLNTFYGGLQNQFVNTAYGKEWKANYEGGMPSIFMSQAFEEGLFKEGAEVRPTAGLNNETIQAYMDKKYPLKSAKGKTDKKLISQEKYVKAFMKYAENGKKWNNQSTEKNHTSPYWKYQQPRAAGNLNHGKDALVMGAQPYPALPGGWIFDSSQAKKDAEKSYIDQKSAYNLFMSRVPGGTEGGATTQFSVRKGLQGEPQGGTGVREHAGYTFVYDHANQDPKAKKQLELMFSQVHGVTSNRIVRFGNEAGNMNNTTDEPKAKFVLDNMWHDLHKTFGKNMDKAGAPGLTITYSESLGGTGADGKYAGYIIELNKDYAKGFKANKDDPTNQMIGLGSWKDNTITVFVKKEFDGNPYNSYNYTPSYVDLAIDESGQVEYEQHPGGGVKFFKNSSGQVMEQTWNYQYDGNINSSTFAEFVKNVQQPRLVDLTGVTMDAYVSDVKKTNSVLAANQNRLQEAVKLKYPEKVKNRLASNSEAKWQAYKAKHYPGGFDTDRNQFGGDTVNSFFK